MKSTKRLIKSGVIGGVMGIAVPLSALVALKAPRLIEHRIIASQTRGKVEQAVKVALKKYPLAKSEPCELGVIFHDGRLPVSSVYDVGWACGEMPVRCYRRHSRPRGPFKCSVLPRYLIDKATSKKTDNWKEYAELIRKRWEEKYRL